MGLATYTLHVRDDGVPGDPEVLDRAVLVRDDFAWGAFLVPALWFLWHRHLGLAFLALVTVGALAIGLGLAGASPPSVLGAEILLHLLIGLEGASLRRWALARRRRPVADIVTATGEAEAESKAFGRWTAEPGWRTGAASVPVVAAEPYGYPEMDRQVTGLFPDPAGRP